jgi:hypothetical protein
MAVDTFALIIPLHQPQGAHGSADGGRARQELPRAKEGEGRGSGDLVAQAACPPRKRSPWVAVS